MTLAAILLASILWTATPAHEEGGMSDQSAPPSASAPAAQGQTAVTSQTQAPNGNQSPPAGPAKPAAGQPHLSAKKPIHRKRAVASGCDAAAASGNSAPSTADSATAPKPDRASAENASAQAPATATAAKNCPPAKIVVRQGGTAEPSIQLAGGKGGDEASQQRDATNQMLGLTETNLKKVAGQQLTASQQDSITQIRQFMEQSRNALEAGETERARTLAWKAELLSEDLVKPQN